MQCYTLPSYVSKKYKTYEKTLFFLDMNVIALYFDSVILGMKLGEVCDSLQVEKLESCSGVVEESLSILFLRFR